MVKCATFTKGVLCWVAAAVWLLLAPLFTKAVMQFYYVVGVCSEADISCGASFAPYMLAGGLTLVLLIAGAVLMDKGWKEDRKDDDRKERTESSSCTRDEQHSGRRPSGGACLL